MSDRQRMLKRSLLYSTLGLVGTGVVAGAFVAFYFGDMAAIVAAMLAMAVVMICAYGKSRTDKALRQTTEQLNDARP